MLWSSSLQGVHGSGRSRDRVSVSLLSVERKGTVALHPLLGMDAPCLAMSSQGPSFAWTGRAASL